MAKKAKKGDWDKIDTYREIENFNHLYLKEREQQKIIILMILYILSYLINVFILFNKRKKMWILR